MSADMTTPVTVWDFTEAAPEWAEPLVNCWSWSLNTTATGNPWTALLDLTGYSMDEFGGDLFPWGAERLLGWEELHRLSAALEVWTNRPTDCADFVTALHACEW